MAKTVRKKKETIPVVEPVTEIQNEQLQTPVATEVAESVKEDTPNIDLSIEKNSPIITQELIEARFKKELTKKGYEEALQKLTDFKVTEDNIGEAQNKILRGRRFLNNDFEAIKTTGKADALAECRMWDKAFNELQKPLAAELEKKQVDLNRIASELAEKKVIADREKARVDDIRSTIDNFLMEQAQIIAVAKTPGELVTIEKVIGSHKGNKSRYADFLPDLVTGCEKLVPLIKTQKEIIRQLEELEANKKKAEETQDDKTLMELEDKKEILQSRMEENKVVVQDVAITEAESRGQVITATPIHTTISARRTTWEVELVKKPGTEELDPKELKKAFDMGLLICTIDPKKAKTVLDTLKSSGSLKGKTEIIVNGVRFFEKKIY